jgi:Fic family protein
VADGNGRLARLVTTHETLTSGYGVARYVSIEQRIYESKHSYYAALYESQRGWRERQHTIWPWTTYLARVVADAYDDLERRIAAAGEPSGSKQGQVRHYILEEAPPTFSRRQVERALPGISQATIRLVLNELRDDDQIEVGGQGPSAKWRVNSPP